MSSEIHQLVDGHGLPLVVFVRPGQAGDAPSFRNPIERGFNDTKQWRGFATRYDKLALTYLAQPSSAPSPSGRNG